MMMTMVSPAFQGAIAKELGVSQRTISNWLNTNGCDGKEAIIANILHLSNNCLSVITIPHYLVVCQTVEKFRPPDGITFPLIIADPPWNISDSRWLSQNNGQATQAITAQTPTIGNNGLATATHSRYLVVCQAVEKFQPPDKCRGAAPKSTSRLGVTQFVVHDHLRKSSEMKNGVNNQLERGFGVNTIAEKLGWPEPLVWAVALEKKAYQGAGRGLYPVDKWPAGKAGVFFIARY